MHFMERLPESALSPLARGPLARGPLAAGPLELLSVLWFGPLSRLRGRHGTVLDGAIDTLRPPGAGSMVPLTR